MANSASDCVLRQVHRLFELGAVGCDDRCAAPGQVCIPAGRGRGGGLRRADDPSRSDGLACLPECASDAHDAEDAFQATFLVLAHRARSIRRHGSIASWLFGVAHRVASRARSDAARRRARDMRVAVRTTESYLPAEECHDWATLARRDQPTAGATSRGRGALLSGRFDVRGGGAAASGVRRRRSGVGWREPVNDCGAG